MICGMCGHMRFDKIKNKVIRGKRGATSIDDKIRETRLRWFNHIRRRNMDALVRRCEKIDRPNHIRSRDKPKKSWNEVTIHDFKTLELLEKLDQDRRL